jgi:Fe-Mn family superoxide dismutase
MPHLNRRQLLQSAGAGALSLALAPLSARAEEKKKTEFTLPKLPYAYDALEPYIDAETMMIHHDKHHAAYVANLNKALADAPDLQGKSIVEVLRGIQEDTKLKPATRQAIINNGGGHANHTMFWQIMTKGGGGEPKGDLAKAIDETFGSFAKLKEQLSTAAATRFGSGWGWLVVDREGKLKVNSGPNQDSPYMTGQTPVIGIDVWEHA